MIPLRHAGVGLVGLVVVLACLPGAASAARYHVRVGGTLTSGPSVADDWDIANCYADLAAAAAAASPADSVLLFDETHDLAAAVTLTALLTNQELAEVAPTDCVLMLASGGSLVVGDTTPTVEVRGIRVGTDGLDRTASAMSTGGAGTNLSTVIVRGCEFAGFHLVTLTYGGAAFSAIGPGAGLVVQLDGCTFSDNQCTNHGGAVYVGIAFDLQMTSCGFTSNVTTIIGRGGALAVMAPGNPTSVLLQDCTFESNLAASAGGAVNIEGASVTMQGCTVHGSRAGVTTSSYWKEGAGVRIVQDGGNAPVDAIIEDCVFDDNQGNLDLSPDGADGGALYLKGELDQVINVNVTGCTFSNNVNGQGAGIYLSRFATGVVQDCHFIDNTAWYQGGGIMKGGLDESVGELVTVIYCEFRGNRAGFAPDGTDTGEYSRGGAILVRNSSRAYVYNSSFADNTVNTASYAIGDAFAHPLEGGEWVPENECELINSAFWGTGNDVQVRTEGGGMGTVSNVAYEMGQLQYPGVPTNPVLLTESPFAGPTDLHLVEGSPLIDAGLDLGYDHDVEGFHVPYGSAPDIGCYEFHSGVAVEDVPFASAGRLSVFPNPFNPRATISAQLDQSADVRLVIFDARGHRVAEILHGELAAGTHDVTWNGCDAAGRAVATGTYVACLEASGRVLATTKLSLVR